MTRGPGFVLQALNKAAVPEQEEAPLLQLIKNPFIWMRARGWWLDETRTLGCVRVAPSGLDVDLRFCQHSLKVTEPRGKR